jgi:NAD(P)-dependent dehydrogenase (short-subunit alcohol dehydrogenase family)
MKKDAKSIKYIFITGGTGKIGSKLIQNLVEEGYFVIFSSRSEEKVIEIEKLYNTKKCKKVFGLTIDLESENIKSELLSFFTRKNIFPDVLINNARNLSYLKIENSGITSCDNWIGEFKLAVIIPYQLSMILSSSEKKRIKRVINIASMYGVVAPNINLYNDYKSQSPINYGVCKSAMIHLTKELAVRLAEKNILVNSISYGGVEGRVGEDFLNRYKKLSPQGRMLKENELFSPIRFLLSEDNTSMTGHNINYDGGWTIW